MGFCVKPDFRTSKRRYTSPNENFEQYTVYPHSNELQQIHLELERCKPHKAAHHPMKCDVIDDVKLFRQYITGYTVANF